MQALLHDCCPKSLKANPATRPEKLAGLMGCSSQDLYRQLMSDNADADCLVFGLAGFGRAHPYSPDGMLKGDTAADRVMLADTLTSLPCEILTKMDRLWQGHVSGRSDHSYQLWLILIFQA
jgi:hypothetical protein